jgi:hypothetical protein
MANAWNKLRNGLNRTDMLMLAANVVAGLVYLGNCWWQSLWICYAAALIPLALLTARWYAAREKALADALIIGLGLGLAWPIGEGITINVLGWWGAYTAPGPYIWHTAAYCVLIGWLATTHIAYISTRALALGFSKTVAVSAAAISAFVIGLAGENFFVAAGMWTYKESAWQWWYIPAFLPIAYALGYAVLPFVQRTNVGIRLAALLACLFVTCTGLGLLTGFFPA